MKTNTKNGTAVTISISESIPTSRSCKIKKSKKARIAKKSKKARITKKSKKCKAKRTAKKAKKANKRSH